MLKNPPLYVRLSGLYGVVAQLGERRVRNAKVGSSILPGSTNSGFSLTIILISLFNQHLQFAAFALVVERTVSE